MLNRKDVELAVAKNSEDLIMRWDKEEIVRTLYSLWEFVWFNFDLDYVDSGADDYVQATVYITNMMWDWSWYNVILDVDFKTRYEEDKEVVDEIMRIEEGAVKMLGYFKSLS